MEVNMDPMQKQMLDDVFDAFTMLAGDSIVTLMHVEGGVTRYTRSAVDLFGLPGEYIPNGAMDWTDWVHPEDRKRYLDVMMPLLDGGRQTYDLSYRVRTVSGEYLSFRVVGAVLRGSDGRPSLIGGALINQGATENVDPVTVLPNKNVFQADLARLLQDGKTALSLQVGISNFASVNSRHGYTFGNRILQEVGWQLQEAVKERASIYRLDGASFGIVSDTLTRDEAGAIYDHVRYQLQRGIEVNGIKTILAANGGLISSRGTDVDVATIASCLRYAYTESKIRKNGELVDFNGSVNYDSTGSMELLNTIRDDAANGCAGFELEYLPVIDARTEGVNGAEALVYWHDEQHPRVEAKDFMPTLEHDFIFEEIGDFVLERGLSDGVRFLEHDPGFLLCLNVYRIQLESTYFIDNLAYYLEETGFPASQLSLKFNSDCRHIGIERMSNIIAKLHERGILVIIGDFGSGTDSIGFLKSEAVDAVSVDKQLISGIRDDEKDRGILEHLTQIAVNYVEHINVKGVDDEQIRDIVCTCPASTMQGDYYARPLSFEGMVEKYYA